VFVFLALLLAGCPVLYTPESNPPEDEINLEYANELFVLYAEDNQEYIKFSAKDGSFKNDQGLTLWTLRGDAEDEFISRSVTLAKTIGASTGGYGMVFCHSEHEIYGKPENMMLVVMINNEGWYIIGKAIGGVFYDYGWWQRSGYLKSNAGAENKITVEYDKTENQYHLYFNDNFIESFKDSEGPQLSGGRNGYIAVITPFDRFPVPGIDIYFYIERD
jgi:hypothetical protein